MTDLVSPPDGIATNPPPASPASDKKIKTAKKTGALGIGGWIATIWLITLTAAAVFAPWLPLDDPAKTDFSVPKNNSSPFTAGHLLGTDNNGYDILARIVWGGRVSLVVAAGVLIIGMLVGGTIGLLAGFFRGKSETLLMASVDVFLAFPALILLIAIVAFLGADLLNVVLGISLVSIPAFARISRATTLTYAQREFVLAARAAGASQKRILAREILPNVILPLLAFGLLVVGIAIVAEGSLAFLGLTSTETISWGGMINGGKKPLQQDNIAHTAMIPAVTMFLTVLAVNVLGDRFRAAFDVKESML
ncbi:MAG: ABC transporter permease [Acidimicrobiia bacterium]|nr:ABC transporter permease [Acidimicrobiia bacterium]